MQKQMKTLKYELTNVRIYAEFNERLYLCYKFGKNVDPMKDLVFNRPIPIEYKEYIDITEKGCSKGLGILKLKELMHLEEVAGIGDSYNDIPMLETVDHSFTFPTSPESLTSIVDDVVDSVEEALDILMKE